MTVLDEERKLHTDTGESPYECARREAEEEIGLILKPGELHR